MRMKIGLASVGLWASTTVLAARHGMQVFESIHSAPEGWKVEGAPSSDARLDFRIALVPVSTTPPAEASSYAIWRNSRVFDVHCALPCKRSKGCFAITFFNSRLMSITFQHVLFGMLSSPKHHRLSGIDLGLRITNRVSSVLVQTMSGTDGECCIGDKRIT